MQSITHPFFSQAPTIAPSSFVPFQQTEPSEQWFSKQTREGGYGEETSDKTRQGVVGASHLNSSNRSHRKAGGSHLELNNSQHLEDGNKTSQTSTSSRPLKESVSLDLINFSHLLNERSQGPVGGRDEKEPSLRYMGDGSQFCNKTSINKSNGQPLVGISQPKENIGQLPKAQEMVAISMRSLLNSDHCESRNHDKPQHIDKDFQHIDEDLLKSNVAVELSRRHLFDDYVKELSSQLMKSGNLDLNQRPITDLNITSSAQFGDIGGHSQSVTFKDCNSQSWLYQAMLDQHLPTIGYTSFNETERSHLRNVSGHSFISGHGQPTVLKDSTSKQNGGSHARAKVVDEENYLKELRNFIAHSQTTSTIPHLSPIHKDHIIGSNREISIHPDHREQSSRSLQPSHRMTDPEESFFPLQMEELSQSFGSHHGFFPLEPLPDRTMSGTGKSYT